MRKITRLLFWCFLLLGCNSSNPSNRNVSQNSQTVTQAAKNELWITREEFGENWALKIDKGMLKCDGKNGFGAITFADGDNVYAINGIAKGTKKYRLLEDIWLDDPKIPGAKKDIAAILDKGRELCH